jgi:hypothetical protein
MWFCQLFGVLTNVSFGRQTNSPQICTLVSLFSLNRDILKTQYDFFVVIILFVLFLRRAP